jgi:Zn-dependent peptidase ImmA (M78 family)
MTIARFKEIRDRVARLLVDVGVAVAPVPVEAIAKHLGAQIRYEPGQEDHVSGMAFRLPSGQAIIGVNAAHANTRRRFTIAHEIGHLLLHEGEIFHFDEGFAAVYGFRDDDGTSGPVKESEANAFAAALLMPEDMIRRDVAQLRADANFDLESDRMIAQIAKRYQVSAQAMTFRLSSVFNIHF